jgi:CRP-like cAMP-binding protein
MIRRIIPATQQETPSRGRTPRRGRAADMPVSGSRTISNRLLNALPHADLEALRSHLEPVSLRLKQIPHQAGEPITHVYFIEQGLASVLRTMEEGVAVECE